MTKYKKRKKRKKNPIIRLLQNTIEHKKRSREMPPIDILSQFIKLLFHFHLRNDTRELQSNDKLQC